MARRRGLTQEEIMKLMQELSDCDSGSETANNSTDIDGDERSSASEYVIASDHAVSSSSSSESENGLATTSSNSDIAKNAKAGTRRRSKGNMKINVIQTAICEETASDGTVWKVENTSNSSGRRPLQNILRENGGPTSYAKRHICSDKPLSAWRLIINEKILRIIKECTDAEAKRILQNDSWNISLQELEAFIALLYVRGALAAKGLPVLSLWSKIWGPKFFPETMSRDRFLEIMKFLRFDNKLTRSSRLQSDKFALISNVWNTFIDNSQLCYKPNENITIDEQLFPTKTRCRFLQYMPNKPDKFGIKFWLAVDVKTKYLLNGFPYLGKDEMRPSDQSLGEYVVNRLVEPYKNTGRNITTDSFFTSLKLAKSVKTKGFSYVGTVNRARREIPPSFKSVRNEIFSSAVRKNDNITLTSYQGKKNKNVILLSTLHSSVEFESNEKKTPDVIKFYNSTKFGVDVLDQMARKYSVKAPSRRWPVHVFYNILDLAGINAWILYKEATKESISRRDFLLRLAEELREEYTSKNKLVPALSGPMHVQDPAESKKRKKCQIKKCKGNKTVNICDSCKKSVCGYCTRKVRKISFCSNCCADE